MNSTGQKICQSFEKEVFLLIDGELSESRIKLIRQHLEDCGSCKSILEEAMLVTAAYNALPVEDIGDPAFNRMINKAVNSSLTWENKQGKYVWKRRSLVELFGFYKLAFGGAVIASAIVLIVLSFIQEPVPEIKLPYEIMDWDGIKLKNKIEKIEAQIISLKTDDWDIYVVRKNEKQNWNTTLRNIRQQINKMKRSTENKGP